MLGKYLASLNDSSSLVGTEGHDSLCIESIYHSQNQRIIGSNCNHIDLELLCKSHNAPDIGCLNVKALGIAGNSAVSGCAVKLVNTWTFGKLHYNSVLTSAAAYYQYIHFFHPFRKF